MTKTDIDTTPVIAGLDGVVVAETELSRVDGERGQLVLRGHDIRQLAGERAFEDVCALLWTGQLPERGPTSADTVHSIQARLAAGRELGYATLSRLGDALDREDGMSALQAALAHFRPLVTDAERDRSPSEREADDLAAESVIQAAHLTGAVATYAAAWWRVQNGLTPVAPSREHTHAADVLRMLHDSEPTSDAVAGLDAYLATVIDHGMNASTFTARVVTSTGASLNAAMVAAIGALSGPLHGGAPGPVLDMLDSIGTPERASAWIDERLSSGHRIMGMGHRVYRVRDPRAEVLERATERLTIDGALMERLALARAVEKTAAEKLQARYPQRRLRSNVEFYTAVLLNALGIDRRLFSLMFAASRTAGWCAHAFEQRARGRLIRPKARYIGPRIESPSA